MDKADILKYNEILEKAKNNDNLIDKLFDPKWTDEMISKKYDVPEDYMVEWLNMDGWSCCPECSLWVESGDMISNPDDDSEQVCSTCADSFGW